MTEEEIEKVAAAIKDVLNQQADTNYGTTPPERSIGLDKGNDEAVATLAARSAITALDQHREGKGAVAWLHTLHMEGGQTSCRVTFDEDDAFGEPGRDYSPEYEVTSEPLFLSASPTKEEER